MPKRGNRRSKKGKVKSYMNDNGGSTSNVKELTEDDIKELELLDIQKLAIYLKFYADILFYEATLEGVELVSNKGLGSTKQVELRVNIDKKVIFFNKLYVSARILLIYVAFTRYSMVYEQKLNGNFPYSLEPNLLINRANIFAILSDLSALEASYGIYERDNVQPVFV